MSSRPSLSWSGRGLHPPPTACIQRGSAARASIFCCTCTTGSCGKAHPMALLIHSSYARLLVSCWRTAGPCGAVHTVLRTAGPCGTVHALLQYNTTLQYSACAVPTLLWDSQTNGQSHTQSRRVTDSRRAISYMRSCCPTTVQTPVLQHHAPPCNDYRLVFRTVTAILHSVDA
jgi:hypothetical protein